VERWIAIAVVSVAVHVAVASAIVFVDPARERPRPREVEIEVFRPPPPEPESKPLPTPEPPEPEKPPEPEDRPPPRAHVSKAEPRPERTTTAAPPTEAATSADDVTDSGGAPVLKMDNLGEGTTAVAPGKRTIGKPGKGGSGGGAGAGEGSGSADAPPPKPVSVASIKTRAKPKGDYGYIDARKDYPPEAKKLGIEGQIKIRLEVSADGKVTKTKILTKLGHGLDQLALERAKLLEFEPALDSDDKPVASVVVWTYTFTLPD
jgi:protein TonB